MVSSDDGQGTGTTTAMLRERLGPFRLLEELGSGAMGTVYRAVDTDEDQTVALKVLHPHLLNRKGFFQRFQREALAGQRVRHDNVVRTLDCSFHVVNDEPFCAFVMEYVRGRTLRDLLHDLGTVPESLVREIGRQVAEGLAAIHEAGLIHRDLKPENVLITDDHRVQIMDLGVARHTEVSTALTKEGQFAGSLPYAAPEQFRVGPGVGPAADLYALGVVLYELTSGVNPFRHDEPGAVMHAHLEVVAERLDRRMEEVSPFLSELVATLLEKEPGARFESASELGGALHDWESSPWWVERKRTVREGRERRVRVPVRRETALHGREADLALLGQVWDRAAQGEGTTVLVEGEAGIGKSRLVDAFLADVDGRDATILYGSYAPTGGRGGISDALLAHFGKADLEEALRPYLGVTPSLVPALAAFLKHDSPPEGSPSLQGDTLHTVLVHLMRGLGAERPLVWVIEDLHFADADSRKLILSLARAVEGHRVLLLLTTRPELPEEELAHLGRLENLVRTWLGRLGAREVISLLQDAFRSQVLAEKLGGKIAFKSDGVPFFVFEMIRGLREGQFITQLPDGSWIESKVIEEIEVPATVRDLIGIRLSGLSREERAILDVGAVQGFEFDPDLVARVLERPRLAVLQDAAEIERRSGILRATAENLRFDQHQIQEVLSNDLLPGLRKEYHWLLFRAMATREGASPEEVDALPGETAILLASHGLQGREPDAGLPYLDRTLDHLAAGLRSEQAVELAVRALGAEGLLQGAARARVLIRLGGADGPLRLLGRFDQIASVSEEAVAVSQEIGEASGEASALANLGHAHNALGQFTEAEGHLEHSVTLFRRIGDRVGESRAAGHLGNLLVNMGLHQRARECHEQCLSLAQECEDRTLVVRALAGLGRTLRVLCDYPAASEKHEQSLAIAREIGDKRGEAIALGELGLTRLRVLDVVGAQECFERDLALLRETGDRAGEMVPTGNLGNVFSLLGDHDAAQHSHERALGIAREIGDRNAEATLAANLGIDYQDQGCLRQAREWFQQDLAISCDIGARGGEMRANANLGHFFLKVGRYEEAKAHTERALTTAREIGRRDTEGTALTNLGAIAESRGDGDASHSRFVEALDLFREIDVRGDAAYLLMRLGRLCGAEGRTRESRRYLEEAISLGRDTGNLLPVFLASCHLAELSGSAPTEAISTFDWCEAGFTPSMEVEARFYLWRATNDPSPLTEAKRLLDHLVEHAPEEYRESMLKNVRVNREIMEAWAEHGEKAVGDGEEPS